MNVSFKDMLVIEIGFFCPVCRPKGRKRDKMNHVKLTQSTKNRRKNNSLWNTDTTEGVESGGFDDDGFTSGNAVTAYVEAMM